MKEVEDKIRDNFNKAYEKSLGDEEPETDDEEEEE